MKLIPEWHQPRSLVLVWPEKLHDRDELIPFYKELIGVLPAGLELTLILKNKKIQEKRAEELRKLNSGITIKYVEISIVEDIWIRDWAPFLCKDKDDEIIAAKMIYEPSYFKIEHRKYAKKDDKAGNEIAKYFGYKILGYEAKWDGGNLAYNGNNYGIVTENLLNDDYMSEDYFWNITTDLGLKEHTTIEAEPDDVTKHTDGFIRFINENTLVITAYPDEYYIGEGLVSENILIKSRKFMDSLADRFSNEFNVVRVTNSIPVDKYTAEMSSAVGNYINYLRIGNKILMPQYGVREDKVAYNKFVELFGKSNIIKVSKEINTLAELGGVLNCISWVAY